MKDLLMAVAKQMVDHPDQVHVSEQQGEETTLFLLSVAKQDFGKIIGKKGKNINAIRTIMGAAAAKVHKRVIVEVKE